MSEEFKQIDYDELIKNSIMITIDDERYDIVYKVFDKALGWHPNKFKGCTRIKKEHVNFDSNLAHRINVKIAHMSAIEYARAHDLPYVFIFEDDAYPCIDCNAKLREYLNVVPSTADILFIGYMGIADLHNQSIDKKINKNISEIWGLQSYIVFKSGYDIAINTINNHLMERIGIDSLITSSNFIKESYVIDWPFFIQYNIKPSESTLNGYSCPINVSPLDRSKITKQTLWWYSSTVPPQGYIAIENYL